ncbi:MAG: MFS transporter [Saprospiraceae bacterium]|nr:MFS transporter [Saprospiraceae bacterium]
MSVASLISIRKDIALSENHILRYITFIVLYFSQGIPEGITRFAIPAWMAINGKSTTEIAGYGAVILIPFSLKILLAPMMERYTFLPMGRRRPWMLFGQFGIWASLIALSLVPQPLDNIPLITVIVLILHIFIMFQDIATDSLVIDIVPLNEQGKANSFMWGSKTVGMSVSLAAVSTMIGLFSFSAAILTMSVSIFLVMFVPLLLRERKGEKLLPWTRGETSPEAALMHVDSWGTLFKSFGKVIVLRNFILTLMTVFLIMTGMNLMNTLLPIFTIQESEWTNIKYSNVYSSFNLAGGILGMVIGGWFIQRFGTIRLIQTALVIQITSACIMAIFTGIWTNDTYISIFIGINCTMLTFLYIGILALCMQLCWKRISAVQFTFCMTILNLALSAGAALLGFLKAFMTWQYIFVVFGAMFVVAIVLLRFVNPKKHIEKIAILENRYING